MTRTKRRQRRGSHDAAPAAPASAARTPEPYIVPLPEWRWRTFPVFAAFAFALLVGIWVGWACGVIYEDNQTPTTVAFIVAALVAGFALSRLTTRFVISRRWVKPRPQRR